MDDDLKRRLAPLRERIDQIDAQILALINQRAQAALEVGEAKHAAQAEPEHPRGAGFKAEQALHPDDAAQGQHHREGRTDQGPGVRGQDVVVVLYAMIGHAAVFPKMVSRAA